MSLYQKAIIKTLAYSSVFKYPLRLGELWRYLIWETKKPVRYKQFIETVETLINSKKIYRINSLHLLINKKSWIVTYNKEKKEAVQKLGIAKRTAFLLTYIPTIELVGLSGKLALSVADKKDDIDLFIVTKKGSLWLTRILILLLLSFIGLKREPGGKETKNKICVNMFADTTRLTIPKQEQDLFSAHEVCQLIPLVSKNNTYEKFLSSNLWVKKYLPNSFTSNSKKQTIKKQATYSLFEKLAYILQKWYMRNKKTNEKISPSYVRFHPHDARDWVLKDYQNNLKLNI